MNANKKYDFFFQIGQRKMQRIIVIYPRLVYAFIPDYFTTITLFTKKVMFAFCETGKQATPFKKRATVNHNTLFNS